jgi:hypothetical protein
MIEVSHHAVSRFIQRYYKRGTCWATKEEKRAAREVLKVWYELSLPFDYNRYIYGDFILVVKNNTIITVLNKVF